ncbi:hypothetical protein B0H17DRAFT_1278916 [Mycena rosella]|uniref:Uncharacterized protein n=1 Tax=Mycena rosella TaxID=1033263 RepID=A0AAD7FTR1_MYCRO|nr:hypothetical protein B0H17DRAFT_1278916 [Mycena rosella]
MDSAPSHLGLDEDLEAAHDQATQAMTELLTDTSIPEEDRRALQDFYNDLEKRQMLLGIEESDSSDEKEYPEAEVKAKAVAFATFLSTLDPKEVPTRLLLEANNLVTIALGNIERGADFLENAPMPKVLDAYERIQSHEATMVESGSPVSMVNAAIYLCEATEFSNMINVLFVMEAPLTAVLAAETSQTTATVAGSAGLRATSREERVILVGDLSERREFRHAQMAHQTFHGPHTSNQAWGPVHMRPSTPWASRGPGLGRGGIHQTQRHRFLIDAGATRHFPLYFEQATCTIGLYRITTSAASTPKTIPHLPPPSEWTPTYSDSDDDPGLGTPHAACCRKPPSQFVYGVKDTATRDRLPTSAQDDEHRDVGLATADAHRGEGSTSARRGPADSRAVVLQVRTGAKNARIKVEEHAAAKLGALGFHRRTSEPSRHISSDARFLSTTVLSLLLDAQNYRGERRSASCLNNSPSKDWQVKPTIQILLWLMTAVNKRSVDQPPVGKTGGIPSKDSANRRRLTDLRSSTSSSTLSHTYEGRKFLARPLGLPSRVVPGYDVHGGRLKILSSGSTIFLFRRRLAANPDASFGLDSDVVPYHIGKRRMAVVAIVRWRQPESRQSGAVGVEPARRAGLSNRACGPASEKKDVQRSTPPDPLARFRGRACEAYREERRKLKIDSHTYLRPGRLLRICREDADRYSARKTLQVLRMTSTARNRLEEEGHAMETKVDVLRTTRGQENLVIPSLAASNCHLHHLRIPPTSHRGDIYHVSGCPGEMGSDGDQVDRWWTRWTSGLKEKAPHVPDRIIRFLSNHRIANPPALALLASLRAGYRSEALLPPVQPLSTGSTRPSEPRITHAGRLNGQPVGPLGSGARREAFRKRTSSRQIIATPTPPQFAQGYYLELPLGKLFSLLQFTPPPSLAVTSGTSTRHPCLERSTAPRYHSAIP